MKNTIQNFDVSILEIDKDKKLVNLTKMAKHFDKRPVDWLRLDSTKTYLESYAEITEKPQCDFLTVVNGGVSGNGTWGNQDIAIKFAQWLNPKFEVFCTMKLKELFTTGSTSLIAQTEEDMLVKLFPASDLQLIQLTAQNIRDLKETRLELNDKKAIVNRLMFVHKTYTSTELAKELNLKSATELNRILHEKKIHYKQNDTWVMYSKYSAMGYELIKQQVLDSGHICYNRQFTQAGRDFIISLFDEPLTNQIN